MRTLAVSELVKYLKNQLDTNDRIQNILVMGEISNFTHHNSGHLYFSIKDNNARISCVMFKGNAYKLSFKPKNGDKVIVKANTSLFEASGQLQLYVSEMKIDGIGDLYLRFEALKNKLYQEGYFDINNKKACPNFPMKIGILVGDKSAALSDIKTTLKRRWPIANVDFYPVLVQGNNSSKDIIDKLLIIDNMGYDAIVLARGGGSIEDLWSFNDEELAKVIYNLKTFIITGIGHEQDYTIADFVADMRAPTPTASIELITPNINDVLEYINDNQLRIINAINKIVKSYKVALDSLNNSPVFMNKYYIIENKSQYLDYLIVHILKYKYYLNTIEEHIKHLILKMESNCRNNIGFYQDHINFKVDNLNKQISKILNDNKYCLYRNETLLNAYNIQNTLNRGFAIAMKDNKVINSVNEFKLNESFELKLKDGSLIAKVEEMKNG